MGFIIILLLSPRSCVFGDKPQYLFSGVCCLFKIYKDSKMHSMKLGVYINMNYLERERKNSKIDSEKLAEWLYNSK